MCFKGMEIIAVSLDYISINIINDSIETFLFLSAMRTDLIKTLKMTLAGN